VDHFSRVYFGIRTCYPWCSGFQGKKYDKEWKERLPSPEHKIYFSDNGWSNYTIAFNWSKDDFEPLTKPVDASKWRILIVDGHGSYITCNIIEFCIKNRIALLCIPPHSTHKLQPLDVKIFCPFASACQKELKRIGKIRMGCNVTKLKFLGRWDKADTVLTVSNIQSAWRATRLVPCNPDVVLDTLDRK